MSCRPVAVGPLRTIQGIEAATVWPQVQGTGRVAGSEQRVTPLPTGTLTFEFLSICLSWACAPKCACVNFSILGGRW